MLDLRARACLDLQADALRGDTLRRAAAQAPAHAPAEPALLEREVAAVVEDAEIELRRVARRLERVARAHASRRPLARWRAAGRGSRARAEQMLAQSWARGADQPGDDQDVVRLARDARGLRVDAQRDARRHFLLAVGSLTARK